MRNRKRTGWHRYVNGVSISTLVTALFIIVPLYWLIATSSAGETTATRSSGTTSASTSGTR
jgi:ABC-type glycerol-3-phosphate transport system permease component